MVNKALDQATTSGHCEPDEKEKILKKKGNEEQLIATYNVLRIHQFLGKYESDLNVRRSKNKPDDKPKLSKQQREEREAAIDHLVARMHPQPVQKDGTATETPEQKAQRKKQREQNKKHIEHFLQNYTEDMHKRRLHIKQVLTHLPLSSSLPHSSSLMWTDSLSRSYRRDGLLPKKMRPRWANQESHCEAAGGGG